MRYTLIFILILFLYFPFYTSGFTITHNKYHYQDKIARYTFFFGGYESLPKANIYQFGHSSACSLFQPRQPYYDLDNVGECILNGKIIGNLQIPSPPVDEVCTYFTSNSTSTILFSLHLLEDLPSNVQFSCSVRYVIDPDVGLTNKEHILFRNLTKDMDPDTVLPVLTNNFFPLITFPSIDMTIGQDSLTSNDYTLSLWLHAYGMWRLTWNTTLYSFSSNYFYCDSSTINSRIGRIYFNTTENAAYIHYLQNLSKIDNSDVLLKCHFTLTPLSHIPPDWVEPQAFISIDQGFPWEQTRQFLYIDRQNLNKFQVVTKQDDTSYIKYTMRLFVPEGIRFGDELSISFKKAVATTIKPTTFLTTFSNSLHLDSNIQQNIEKSWSYVQNKNGITLRSKIDSFLLYPSVLYFEWLLDALDNQGDIHVTVSRSRKMPVYHGIYPLSSILYVRSIIHNNITKYEFINDGYDLLVQTNITTYMNNIDNINPEGWVTQFYITDSYIDVSRNSTCYYQFQNNNNNNNLQTTLTHYANDFGTIYAYINETLLRNHNVLLTCTLPILYPYFYKAYKPPSTFRQLRIATWSYDLTTSNGLDLYEDNNDHSIIPLETYNATQIPVIVLQFYTNPSITASETYFTKYFIQVVKALNNITDDNNNLIWNNGVTTESVYGILNYKIANISNPLQYSPYTAISYDNLYAPTSTVAIGIPIPYNKTLDYFIQQQDNMNKNLIQYNVTIHNIETNYVLAGSNGLSNCGSPTARKCLTDAICTQHTQCSGDDDCFKGRCLTGYPAFNPWNNSSSTIYSSYFLFLLCFIVIISILS